MATYSHSANRRLHPNDVDGIRMSFKLLIYRRMYFILSKNYSIEFLNSYF